MLAATLVDAALLAYEPVSESPNVAPTVSLGKDHAYIGATGTFSPRSRLLFRSRW